MCTAPRRLAVLILALLSILCIASSLLRSQVVELHVDLTDAPRNIYHAKLKIPVHSGDVALVFPKWIPGNHRPSGPVGGLTGIRMEAAGHPLSWQRDSIEMYEFHVTVPTGVESLDVSLDAITSQDSAGGGGPAASANVLDLNWNAVVLYPKGARSDDVSVAPSITLPAGWKFGTALQQARVSGDEIEFSPVSLTTLIDSPVIAGSHYRKIELTKAGESPAHVMDLVAEADSDLAMTPQDVSAYQKLVAETGALFGARHYRQYHFLLTLSSQVGEHGLEHHESNDSVASERTLLEPDLHMVYASLVPHEFVHSWNGKYRRPAGLATPNYQEPMIADLLWVLPDLGDPMSHLPSVPSNGTGSGGGIGSGSGGGVGSGEGPGFGPGHGGGTGGGAYRVGGGVSGPRLTFSPDPEYSEEARKAKFQGTCVLWVVVGADGRPRDIRVARTPWA